MTLSIIHKFTSGVPNDPAAIAAGEVVPTEWNDLHSVTGTVGPEIGARTILTANTNFYVATTGNDSNPGTLASPWATIQHAYAFIAFNIDIAGFFITINVGAGSFVGAGNLSCIGGGQIGLVGAGSGSTTVNAGPNDGTINFGENFDRAFADNTIYAFNSLTFNITLFVGIINYTEGGTVFAGMPVGSPTPATMDLVFTFTVSTSIGVLQGFTRAQIVKPRGGNVAAQINFTPASQAIVNGPIISFNQADFFDNSPWTITGTPIFSAGNNLLDFESNSSYEATSFATWSGTATGPSVNVVGDSSVQAQPLPGSSTGSVDDSSSFNGQLGFEIARTVGTLGAATNIGQRAFVTDSNTTLAAGLGNIVATGGGNKVPVYADGTNWRIG